MSTSQEVRLAAVTPGSNAATQIDDNSVPARAKGFARPAAADRPTPYIEVDEVRLVRNIKAMQHRADIAGCLMFPHVKTHKSLHIARQQLALGARGITASKPSEALVFAEAGIPSIILAYPIVTPQSLDRLLPVVKARGTQLRAIAASLLGVEALSAAATHHSVEIAVFLKVDVGLGRVGLKPDDPAALDLCAKITAANSLRFAGLLSHAGHSYASAGQEELAAVARDEAANLSSLAEQLRRRGIAVDCISVGATPTCVGAPLPPTIDCVRPGNYVFLDGTALRLGICTADDLALSVVARVVASNDTHFIIDAGSKSMSSDRGAHGTGGASFGTVVSADGGDEVGAWTLERLSEEHGFVPFSGRPLPLGSRVRVFPNHSCASIANFDAFTLHHADGHATTMPVDARCCQT